MKEKSEWRKQGELERVQLYYWLLTPHFQLTILISVQSLREGNFQLNKDASQ